MNDIFMPFLIKDFLSILCSCINKEVLYCVYICIIRPFFLV